MATNTLNDAKTSLFMHSYTVEREHFPELTEKGFRYGANFEIKFGGAAYTTIVLTVLWNQKKTLIAGTNQTETKVTDAGVSITKSGAGWAVVADIPGQEAWVDFHNTVIRFRKSFTLEVPISPAIAKIPVIGEMAKDLGATKTSRVEAEGSIDVVSYVSNMMTQVF
jgi:hypothetical protein